MLTKMTYLHFGYNNLRGTIPTELGNLGRSPAVLTELTLIANQFTGTIPTELGLMTTIRDQLLLDVNFLTGTVPTEYV
jgi:hypothetical protein